MSKQIIIIGGGISGLSVLHYLKTKFPDENQVKILLLEKNKHVGGTAHSEKSGGFLFEHGPNGFLDSKESTIKLVKELGLTKAMIKAKPAAKKRFISINNKLHQIPMNPIDFFSFQPMTPSEKFQIFMEIFKRKGKDPDESLYDFAARRFGEKFAQIFIDSMAAGIFAGDARELSIKSAFPRIYEIEQTYGSLFKGMFFIGRHKKKSGPVGQPGGRLTSFKDGVAVLCEAIKKKYTASIKEGVDVLALDRAGEGYSVETKSIKYYADKVFVCTPAYCAAAITSNLNAVVSEMLMKIRYVPVAVVGLVYARDDFNRIPQGFGYLIPSSEKKDVLGVLFPSNIFPGRTDDKHFMFRVMIGGARNPGVASESGDKLVEIAKEEINTMFHLSKNTVKDFCAIWHKAIPQYDKEYAYIKEGLLYELTKLTNFHLVANYLGGISMPDCVANAKLAVEECSFVENKQNGEK